MNGKLVLLGFVLSIPYTLWVAKIVASDEIDALPSWVPLAALVANFTFVIPILAMVRIRLRKRMHEKRDADAAKAAAERQEG
jgi:TRAP-type C4-dicarboxylate transport system permease small subunit